MAHSRGFDHSQSITQRNNPSGATCCMYLLVVGQKPLIRRCWQLVYRHRLVTHAAQRRVPSWPVRAETPGRRARAVVTDALGDLTSGDSTRCLTASSDDRLGP